MRCKNSQQYICSLWTFSWNQQPRELRANNPIVSHFGRNLRVGYLNNVKDYDRLSWKCWKCSNRNLVCSHPRTNILNNAIVMFTWFNHSAQSFRQPFDIQKAFLGLKYTKVNLIPSSTVLLNSLGIFFYVQKVFWGVNYARKLMQYLVQPFGSIAPASWRGLLHTVQKVSATNLW